MEQHYPPVERKWSIFDRDGAQKETPVGVRWVSCSYWKWHCFWNSFALLSIDHRNVEKSWLTWPLRLLQRCKSSEEKIKDCHVNWAWKIQFGDTHKTFQEVRRYSKSTKERNEWSFDKAQESKTVFAERSKEGVRSHRNALHQRVERDGKQIQKRTYRYGQALIGQENVPQG